jgi:hypothetical protein
MNKVMVLVYFVGISVLLTILYLSFLEPTKNESCKTTETPISAPPTTSTPTSTPPPTITEEEAIEALKDLARKQSLIASNEYPEICKSIVVGKGWGSHRICSFYTNTTKTKPCKFISYGISRDYSFDKQMVEAYGCQGVGLDPTVNYHSQLLPGFTFIPVGAPVSNKNRKRWTLASPIQVAEFFGFEHIEVLKMDCEGCEYAIADSLLKKEPRFFDRVNQFAVEIHVAQRWLSDHTKLMNYGRLLVLLKNSGLELIDFRLAHCNPFHEKSGCLPELLELGYPCRTRIMCQNILFARVDKEKDII